MTAFLFFLIILCIKYKVDLFEVACANVNEFINRIDPAAKDRVHLLDSTCTFTFCHVETQQKNTCK
jgi:hypothetical protein